MMHRQKMIASPATNTIVLKVTKASEKSHALMDSAELNVRRVQVSTINFVALAGLVNLTPTVDTDIKLVSIPQIILSVVMHDATLPNTDVSFLLFLSFHLLIIH
jgi:hypothetical protein